MTAEIQMNNNNIFFVDKKLNYKKYSVESAHSLNVNRWQGWYCSTGFRNLYVDFDGNVFRGVCGEGGWMGNVNRKPGLEGASIRSITDKKWIVCNKESCTCGSDMKAPKVKDFEDTHSFFDRDRKQLSKYIKIKEEISEVEPSLVYGDDGDLYKLLIWDIGRRCNFDCWYCSKNSHNTYEVQKNLDMLMSAYETLSAGWIMGERTKFVFTGGEPTVYKDYLPFIAKLKEADHIIHTTTNGSATPEYYKQLAEISDITFSIHLNYVQKLGIDKFLKAVESAVVTTEQGFVNNTVAQFNWIIVRIMFDPGNLEIAKLTYNTFKEQFKNYKNYILEIDLVHQTDGDHVLYKYTQEELNWMADCK